jgi:hypothetical protein
MSRPNASLQTLLEKLLLAGWVSATGTAQGSGRRVIRGIAWTDEGLMNCSAIGILLENIEANGGRLANAEILALRALIQEQGKGAR